MNEARVKQQGIDSFFFYFFLLLFLSFHSFLLPTHHQNLNDSVHMQYMRMRTRTYSNESPVALLWLSINHKLIKWSRTALKAKGGGESLRHCLFITRTFIWVPWYWAVPDISSAFSSTHSRFSFNLEFSWLRWWYLWSINLV